MGKRLWFSVCVAMLLLLAGQVMLGSEVTPADGIPLYGVPVSVALQDLDGDGRDEIILLLEGVRTGVVRDAAEAAIREALGTVAHYPSQTIDAQVERFLARLPGTLSTVAVLKVTEHGLVSPQSEAFLYKEVLLDDQSYVQLAVRQPTSVAAAGGRVVAAGRDVNYLFDLRGVDLERVGILDGERFTDVGSAANPRATSTDALKGIELWPELPPPLLPHAVQVAAHDLTGDGTEELIVLNAQTGWLRVYLDMGEGRRELFGEVVLGEPGERFVPRFLHVSTYTEGRTRTPIVMVGVDRPDRRAGTVELLLWDPLVRELRRASISAVEDPRAIASGDFTGDGILDLVVAGSREIVLLRGLAEVSPLGMPSFASPTPIRLPGPSPVYDHPLGIASGDFTGDGRLDFALAHPAADVVEIYLGAGGGRFERTEIKLPSGSAPSILAVTDLNANGIPDMLVLTKAGTSLIPLYGLGDGTFRPLGSRGEGLSRTRLDIRVLCDEGEQVWAAALADPKTDLRGAGSADVRRERTLERSGIATSWFWQLPRLVHALPWSLSTQADGLVELGGVTSVRTLAAAELIPGLPWEIAAVADGKTRLFAGQGTRLTELLTLPNGFYIHDSLAVGRFGEADQAQLALLRLGTHMISVLAFRDEDGKARARGVGYGMLPADWPEQPQWPTMLLAADLSGDGREDLLVAHHALNRIAVLQRNETELGDPETRLFGDPVSVSLRPVLDGPVDVAVGDVDGDGEVEILVAGHRSRNVVILKRGVDAKWEVRHEIKLAAAPTSLMAVDLDGDGVLDLIVVATPDGLEAYRVDGGWRFSRDPAVQLERPIDPNVTVRPLQVRALAADGTWQLAVLSAVEERDPVTRRVAVREEVRVHSLGVPAPGPAATRPIWTTPPADRETARAFVDLAIAPEQEASVLAVLQPSGTMAYLASLVGMDAQALDWCVLKQVTVDDRSTALTAVDINANGHTDIVTLETAANRVRIHWGPHYDAETSAGLPVSASPVALAAGASPQGAWVLGGNVAWVSARPGVEPWKKLMLDLAGGYPRSALTASLSGERSPPDLVILAYRPDIGTDEIRIFSGRDMLHGVTSPWRVWAMPHRVAALAVGDFDADGLPDIAVAYRGQESGEVWLGSGVRHTLRSLGTDCVALAAGDVTGNGKADVVALCTVAAAGRVTVYAGIGDGSFSRSSQELRAGFPMGTGGVLLGDVNHNGKLDVITFDRASGAIVVFHNGGHQDMERTIAGLRIVDRGFVPSFAGVR